MAERSRLIEPLPVVCSKCPLSRCERLGSCRADYCYEDRHQRWLADTSNRRSAFQAHAVVALNDIDYRVGETHHNVQRAANPLSDADVELIRDQYEAHALGHPEHIGYRALAKRWGVSKRTIRDIVEYKRRNQWVARWKRVIARP